MIGSRTTGNKKIALGYCCAILISICISCQPLSQGTKVEGLNIKKASEIAEAALAQNGNPHHFTIIDEETKEHAFGFSFSYVPQKFLETKNPDDLIPGNGPLIVDRSDNSARFLTSAGSATEVLRTYEEEWLKVKRDQKN